MLTTNGALTTTAVTVIANTIPANCGSVGIRSFDLSNSAIKIYPNPFNDQLTIKTDNTLQSNTALLNVYNVLGELVLTTSLSKETTVINKLEFPSGIYSYKIVDNNKLIQSGRLISQ